eukprot:1194881-Prorocentrum_minimum.AAC.4
MRVAISVWYRRRAFRRLAEARRRAAASYADPRHRVRRIRQAKASYHSNMGGVDGVDQLEEL